MPQYQYQGFNSVGKNIKGIIKTESLASAKQQLKKDGIFVSQVKEVVIETGSDDSQVGFLKSLFVRISTDDMAGMTRQLATLIAAHIPLVEALDALVDQIENQRLKAVISKVRTDVNEGAQLHRALARYPEIFPDLFVSMVESGEASGALDVVLLRLADFTEYQAKLKKRVTGAMFYPVLMLGVGFTAVMLIFTLVIPKFETIFQDQDLTLPAVTQVILWLSRFLISYWWAVLVGVFLSVYLIRKFLKSPGGRRWWDAQKLKLPIFGDLIRMVAISRFTKTLSTLLESGIPLLIALQVVKNVVGNITIREAIEEATTNLTEGQGISGPLRRSGQFPPMVTHMISVGEQTGEMEEMLERVAEHYDYQVDTRIQSFTTLIEPIMILFLAGVVLIIVVSVILPMMEMTNIDI